MKALSNSAVKPLIMDSVTTSLNTYQQYETYLSPKEQNQYCKVANKPDMHIPIYTDRSLFFQVGVGRGRVSFRFYSLQTENVPCSCNTVTKLFPKCKCVVPLRKNIPIRTQ